MALDLDIPFSIISGNIEQYRETTLGNFIINIDDFQYPQVKLYLDKKAVSWKELNSKEIEDL